MAEYNSSFTGTQIDTAVGKIVANSETAGKVLKSDGNGGASWQNESGGGGGANYVGQQGVVVNNTATPPTISLQVTSIDPDRIKRPTATDLTDSTSGTPAIITGGTGEDPHWAKLEYEGIDVKSTGETSGYVLTADGQGGADWAPASGGTTVVANPTPEGTTPLTGLQVGSNKYVIQTGTVVEANPTQDPSSNNILTKINIGGTVWGLTPLYAHYFTIVNSSPAVLGNFVLYHNSDWTNGGQSPITTGATLSAIIQTNYINLEIPVTGGFSRSQSDNQILCYIKNDTLYAFGSSGNVTGLNYSNYSVTCTVKDLRNI